MQDMNCVELARVALVCQAWRSAATSSGLWRRICEQELGPCMPAAEPADWHQHFRTEQRSGGMQYAALCARFGSALQAVTDFKLVLHAHNTAPQQSSQLQLQDAAGIPPVSVYCTSQSIWLQFLLPYSDIVADLQVVAEVGEQGSVCLLDSKMFRALANERDRVWRRQLEGLEAWSAHGQTLPDDELDSPSWLMVYIHQEQLLRTWPFHTPQVFPAPLFPNRKFRSWTDAGLQLFIEFCSEHGCLAVLRTARLAPTGMDLSPRQIGIQFEASLLSAEEVSMTTSLGRGGCVGPARRAPVLKSLLGGNCLANFTLLDDQGCLLLGRAALMWEAEQEEDPRTLLPPEVTYRAQFALNEAANCNFITIRPAKALVGLSICPRAAFAFGWCS